LKAIKSYETLNFYQNSAPANVEAMDVADGGEEKISPKETLPWVSLASFAVGQLLNEWKVTPPLPLTSTHPPGTGTAPAPRIKNSSAKNNVSTSMHMRR